MRQPGDGGGAGGGAGRARARMRAGERGDAIVRACARAQLTPRRISLTKAGTPGGPGATELAPRGSDARGEGAGRTERLAEPRAVKNKAISFETKMKQTWPGKAKYLPADVNKGEKSSQGTLSFCASPQRPRSLGTL